MATPFTSNFLAVNNEQTKNLSLVVQINGIDYLSNRPIYKKLRFGDPGITYGAGYVYGQLIPRTDVQSILNLDGTSLTLSQKNEPEQGKASVAAMTLAFNDQGGYMTQVIAPGILLPEILGQEIKVYLGYQELSFPEDYAIIFRGRVSDASYVAGKVTLQVSDPNINRRQNLFFTAKTTLTARCEYNSLTLYDVTYIAQPGHGTEITIALTGGGTAGAEVVTVTGNAISIQIQDGVSTADQVSHAVGLVTAATNLVSVAVTGLNTTVNHVTAATHLKIDTSVTVASATDFHQAITKPGGGGYDPAIRTYLKVEDEWFEYGPSNSIPTGTLNTTTGILTNLTRAQRGSISIPHAVGVGVEVGLQITDHAIDLALKLMLSGWAGPFATGVALQSIVFTGDGVLGDQANAIILPNGVDAVRDYNLSTGDLISISGSGVSGNNVTEIAIAKFGDLDDQTNRMIYLVGTVTLARETSTTGVAAFRSQYDSYPLSCGSKLKPEDVDVTQHVFVKATYLGSAANDLEFFLTSQQQGKSFIESELYLPVSCYSLTRQGQLSVGITKPPIADQRLQFLTKDNVLEPERIKVSRGLNSRKFFNEIDWFYDFDDQGNFTNTVRFLDADSLNAIGIVSALPIQSRGARTSLGSDTLFSKRSAFLLSRYKRGAAIIENVKVTWGVGCQIEAGDVVALTDGGVLQLANFETGKRDLGTQLYEVVDRSLDIKSGNVTLKLIAGVGAQTTDRFATVSPSSRLATGSTASQLVITDSYGAVFPGDEPRKWRDYVGQEILVHDEGYTVTGTTILQSVDPSNNYRFNVSPALGFTPISGYIVDVPNYPNTALTSDNQIYKAIHAFLDPHVLVVSGVSATQFTVGAGDASKFIQGAFVRVHKPDYSVDSGDLKVTLVSGTTITVEAMGFTPDNTFEVDLMGFLDHGGAYRYI